MAGLSIDGVFAEILKANRPQLNEKFATAQRLHPALDPLAFSELLVQTVAPLVSAAARFDPACTRQVALSLYDLALELLAQGLLGPNSRHPFLVRGWQELLPQLPAQLCAAPRQICSALTNALYNLEQVPGARPQEWLEALPALAPLAPDPQLFLKAGQILAWRAGLAHYRQGALELCRTLPPGLVRAALGLPPSNEPDPLLELLGRLAADPWLSPEAAGEAPGAPTQLKIIRRVGAFRGFGGLFLQPPLVFPAGEHFLVQEGSNHWLLVADLFGASLHRMDGFQPSESTAPFAIDREGNVTWGSLHQKFETLAGCSSAASNGSTLAVTSHISFAISLVAPLRN